MSLFDQFVADDLLVNVGVLFGSLHKFGDCIALLYSIPWGTQY